MMKFKLAAVLVAMSLLTACENAGGKETALITLCVGAGMGTATIIERV